MDGVCTQWKRLKLDDDDGGVMKDEQLRKIAYLEITDLKPPSQPLKTKGAPKKGNGNCGFRVVSALLSEGEGDHTLVRHQLIQYWRGHKESYTRLYEKKETFDTFYESLVPCISGPTPENKWMCFYEMENFIENVYDRVCGDLTSYSFSKTFFPLHTAPPKNPNDRIMCVGWISNLRHFVQVYLKPKFPIPLTS
ncbi:uncharacterized protein LOC131628605 [Vicia villosa]|uniref:uncharacterized protein LOC131628605 n=1 Tax=Vicia villosa TaxID=3911 RepID=UPI00273CE84A|nr:uncharacterized protein LOC131628605 [Vicia villosa]